VSAARLGMLLLVASLALAAGGCGGDDESSAEAWANDVCGNLSQWITDVDEAVRSLTAEGLNFDTDDIRDAVDQAKSATEDLVDDLQGLGPPDTEAGQEAQDELEELQGVLESQVETVEQALDSGDGALALAGTISTALAVAINELEQAFESLQGLDSGGELEDAFTDSEDCDSLREQVEEITS
jgi:hypothetical protein